MKRIALLCLLLLLAATPGFPQQAAPAPSAISPAKRALIAQLLSLEGLHQQIQSALEAQARDVAGPLSTGLTHHGLTQQQALAFRRRFVREYLREANAAHLEQSLDSLLNQQFTSAELKQLIAFYRGPLGAKLAQAQTAQRETLRRAALAWSQPALQRVLRNLAASYPQLQKDPGAHRPGDLKAPAQARAAIYPSPRQAAADLRNAQARAARLHKNVLVDFGGNWCYDCHVLDAALRHSSLALLVRQNYIVVDINVGDSAPMRNQNLAQKLGVNLAKGVPALAVLDPAGKVLVAQKNGEFEDARNMTYSTLRAFLLRWRPAPAH